MSNEYDIERYDREREERIKHLETLKEQAEEEFNSYHKEKRDNFERDGFDYIEEEEDPSAKKKLIGLASVALLGVAGYFGYNSLSSSDTPKTDKVAIESQAKGDDDVKTQIASIVSDAMKKDKDVQEKVDVSRIVEDKSPDRKDKQSEDSKSDIENRVDLAKDTTTSSNQEELRDSAKTDIATTANRVAKHITQVTKERRRANNSSKTYKKKRYRVVTVRKGDTLASIAERYYGNPMYYKKIARANKIWKSSRLKVGQKIIVPQLDERIRKRLYRIRRGDTLRRISKRFYGTANKVQKIVDANYKIKSAKSRLNVGDIIYIPK